MAEGVRAVAARLPARGWQRFATRTATGSSSCRDCDAAARVTADDRLHAVLIEPKLARFRELCGVVGVALTASWTAGTGMRSWRRIASTCFRATLPTFLPCCAKPRSWKRSTGAECRCPGCLDAGAIGRSRPTHSFAVSRCPGRTWRELETAATLDAVATILESLGGAIASWHRLGRRQLPRRLRRRRDDIDDMLDSDQLWAAAAATARVLGLPRRQAADWFRELEPLMAMEPVLVHGDVNEGQVVVDDTLSVTCVLDWERAHVGHPLKDFDFGEWGYGIFAWEPHFGLLRRRMWEAYVAARGGALPSWRSTHLAFCLAWAYGYTRWARLNDWARARLASNLELLRQMAG